jgi:O-antigen ligase
VVIAAVAMAMTAADGYLGEMGTIIDTESNYSFTEETGRIVIWTRGLGYLKEQPYAGVGNFARAVEEPDLRRVGAQVPAQALQTPASKCSSSWACPTSSYE